MSDKFQNWLATYGQEKLATRLNVSPHTVHFWRFKRGWPRVDYIVEIVRLSKGVLTFDDIVKSTMPKGWKFSQRFKDKFVNQKQQTK